MSDIVQVEPHARAAKPVVIQNGQFISAAVDLEGWPLVAIEVPPAWTTANLTFQAAEAMAGTFQDVHDDAGTVVVLQAGTGGRCIVLASTAAVALMGLRYLKVRSGTGAVPVVQADNRTLQMITRQGA